MLVSSDVRCVGVVERVIEHKNGTIERTEIPNTILRSGRSSLAKALANQIGEKFDFYISRMLFGDGGSQSGARKYVNADRNGLFGTTRLAKPVISVVDPNIPTQVIFTSIITFDEAIGVTLNEMALQMNTNEIYSMTTFPDLNKGPDIQLTYSWRLNFI